MNSRLCFDFWGSTVATTASSPEDREHLAYYFSDYIVSECAHPRLSVHLQSKRVPICRGVDPEQGVWIRLDRTGPWRKAALDGENPTASVLPPLSLSPLSARFQTIHGACASPPSCRDRATIIHGSSGSGKSTLLLSLLREGWEFLSDDVVLVASDHRITPFTRPIGVREQTLERLPWLKELVPLGRRFTTASGETVAIHPKQIVPNQVPLVDRRWQSTVVVQNCRSFSWTQMGPTTFKRGWDPGEHLVRALDQLENGLLSE